jgi:hypothetical protein
MRRGTLCTALVVLGAALPRAAGGESPRPADAGRYAALSGLIKKAVVGRLPKVYEDDSGWGQTIPVPERFRRPRLRRTYVKVGDHWELPSGTWRKVRVWLGDPSRDLDVRVRDLKRVDGTRYHLSVDADAALRGEADIQQWLKGLLLVDATARADADVAVALQFDVKVELAGKLPPEVKVEPHVTGLKMDLKDFKLHRVTFHRAGLTVEGADSAVGEQLKGALRDLLRAAEPEVRRRANEAIARGLREGRGTLSAADLLKAVPAPHAKE